MTRAWWSFRSLVNSLAEDGGRVETRHGTCRRLPGEGVEEGIRFCKTFMRRFDSDPRPPIPTRASIFLPLQTQGFPNHSNKLH